MALTDTAIKQAKPASKPYTLTDGDGLSLQVPTTGSKRWHWYSSIAADGRAYRRATGGDARPIRLRQGDLAGAAEVVCEHREMRFHLM